MSDGQKIGWDCLKRLMKSGSAPQSDLIDQRTDMTTTLKIDFVSDVSFGCDPPLTAHFISIISPSGSYNYLWDFGNSTTGSGANPTAVYTQATNVEDEKNGLIDASTGKLFVPPGLLKSAEKI